MMKLVKNLIVVSALLASCVSAFASSYIKLNFPSGVSDSTPMFHSDKIVDFAKKYNLTITTSTDIEGYKYYVLAGESLGNGTYIIDTTGSKGATPLILKDKAAAVQFEDEFLKTTRFYKVTDVDGRPMYQDFDGIYAVHYWNLSSPEVITVYYKDAAGQYKDNTGKEKVSTYQIKHPS